MNFFRTYTGQDSLDGRSLNSRASAPEMNIASKGVRPAVKGKFIFVGDRKFYVRGVTYGPFHLDENGSEYHTPEVVERDFAEMARNGINAVRTYTLPPKWLLDIAYRNGLRVMLGIPWEQHLTFLDYEKLSGTIEENVRERVREYAGHPSILCYVVGNEIPAPIVRWHGRHHIERFIQRLYSIVKSEDPMGLVTYVNYPTTEYLQLSFLDFICFNVYLESQESFDAYLARLQNIAGDQPLVMAEIGLDSRRNGEESQAKSLAWLVRTVFSAGCAGAFVFAWTDEWYRGGHDIDDWDFGLTRRDRTAKPALAAVRKSYAETPFPPEVRWPKISVVVCVYNGESTIRECLDGLKGLEYPDYEVIVVDDGSEDATASIASESGYRVISTVNCGLSSARNTGMEAATGEIVAYIDGDAYPDPHWLTYLAWDFLTTNNAGVGGPNIPPPGDGMLADCVSNAPGGPIHVLLTDWEAEHIPGCNIAFRKNLLKAIGGFDPQYRAAGDDVDVCWRMQQEGWTLGFSPAAIVWHHRRDSVKGYWKQQKGYGKAEALLEQKWPEKYNTFGHLTWKGRLYGDGYTRSLPFGRWRVYHGVWGSGLFQSIYAPTQYMLASLPLMPEWYLVILGFGGLSALGMLWKPLLLALPFLALSVAAPIIQAFVSALHARPEESAYTRFGKLRMRTLVGILHLAQPLARLVGRVLCGLTPLRRRGLSGWSLPRVRDFAMWSESWESAEARLQALESALRSLGVVVRKGGDFDRWDLEVSDGTLGAVRTQMVIEEHGGGRQLVRFRCWPVSSTAQAIVASFFGSLSVFAAADAAWITSWLLGVLPVSYLLFMVRDCGIATAALVRALKESGFGEL